MQRSLPRHCRQVVVTASIDELHFIEPVKQGDVVILKGQVNAAFNTSMEIGVTVDNSEDPLTGLRRKAVKAYLTYVALDRHGRPQKVPALTLSSEEDKRRNAEAIERRQARLDQKAERIRAEPTRD